MSSITKVLMWSVKQQTSWPNMGLLSRSLMVNALVWSVCVWEGCAYMHAYVRACIYACMRAYVCTCMCAFVPVCACVCVCFSLKVCVCVCVCLSLQSDTYNSTFSLIQPSYEVQNHVEVWLETLCNLTL